MGGRRRSGGRQRQHSTTRRMVQRTRHLRLFYRNPQVSRAKGREREREREKREGENAQAERGEWSLGRSIGMWAYLLLLLLLLLEEEDWLGCCVASSGLLLHSRASEALHWHVEMMGRLWVCRPGPRSHFAQTLIFSALTPPNEVTDKKLERGGMTAVGAHLLGWRRRGREGPPSLLPLVAHDPLSNSNGNSAWNYARARLQRLFKKRDLVSLSSIAVCILGIHLAVPSVRPPESCPTHRPTD